MGKMDQEIIRFSVIMPLYNKAAYVEKGIRSVLEQTYPHYELIVVNDGSTDASAVIAEELLKGVHNARLINQENAGVAVARNNGVAEAKGDFVCFLDADDWWDVSFLQEMQQFIKDYPKAGIWGTNYWYVKRGMTRLMNQHIPDGYIDFCKEHSTLAQVLWTGSVCILKSVYKEMNGFKPFLKLGEDFDLWIRVALKYKVAYLNKPLTYYNQNVDTLTRGTGKLHHPKNNMLWNLQYLEDQEKNNPYYKQLIDRLRVYGLFNYYLSNEYRDLAEKELAKVDWSKQPNKIRLLYKKPIWYLRSKQYFMNFASFIKQSIIRLIVK